MQHRRNSDTGKCEEVPSLCLAAVQPLPSIHTRSQGKDAVDGSKGTEQYNQQVPSTAAP